MLNSKLHEALLKAFGSVVVENEGVQADIEMDYSSIYGTAWRVARRQNGVTAPADTRAAPPGAWAARSW